MHSWSLIHVPHWYLTNGSPIHCQHTTDAIMTKSKKTNRQTPLGQYIGWFLDWQRTGIAIDISMYSLPRCRPDSLVKISADTPYKTSDPWFISYIFYGISLLWKGKKCSYLILGTLKPGMAKLMISLLSKEVTRKCCLYSLHLANWSLHWWVTA